jgi:hypothetical protein
MRVLEKLRYSTGYAIQSKSAGGLEQIWLLDKLPVKMLFILKIADLLCMIPLEQTQMIMPFTMQKYLELV